MATTNFDSGSLVTNDGVTSATYSGWTFGASSAIDFANADTSELAVLLNQSGGRSIILNYSGANVTNFYFKSSDGSDFQLNSFKIDNGPNGASSSLTIAGYRDGALIVAAESVNLASSDSAGNISYTQQNNLGSIYSGLLAFNSTFNNIDEIRFAFNSAVELTVDDIDISAAVVPPTITSATYDANSNSLVVTGTNITATIGATNDIDVSKLTLTGQGGATYTLTSSNVEITSATQFTVALNATDQLNVEGLLNKNGTASVGATTYNIAAAADWNPSQSGNADTTGNAVTVSNVQTPTMTFATYDASTGTVTVTGSNLVKASGAANDIDASRLTFTGEGGSTHTLTDSSDVEITSATAFTVTLSSTDKAAVNQIVNKNGTSSTSGTTYNLAAADDWNTVIGNTDIADATGNGITVSNVAIPAITSAAYNASTGELTVTGSGFLTLNGAANDIDASKFTVTAEGGATYTLTDSADVEITSGTAFTLTLSSADKTAVNEIVNKSGTSSTGGTTYNLAAAEDWAAGADSAATVADLTGNGITASNVAAPTITSATYDAGTGALVVTGSGFLKFNGAANDIDASKFTFTGEGGATHMLTDSSDVEITSGTAFTVTLSSTDQAAVSQMINKNGTSSTSGTTYNLAAAEDWATGASAAVNVADLTGNGITASNIAVPTITSAAYDYSSNTLTVTGSGFLKKSGAGNDIDVSKLTFTGEGGATYTLTTATDVEITSGTSFSVTLTGADLINVETLLNKNGTSSVSTTPYNLAGAEDWAAGADSAIVVADLTGNAITVSNYAAPAMTSATFDAATGILTVTGTNFVANGGATNDIDVSLLTIAGEGGNYSLTSSDVEITSSTSFSITLNAADQLVAQGLLNKNGTTSSGATTYNIAAADNWMTGSATSVNVADLTGNGITVSNVPTPTVTSATYDANTGALTVTGTDLFNKMGANNDIDISMLTLTGGTGNATYTLTSASDIEITSATSFSVTLSGTDKTNVDVLLDQMGTTSSGGSTYNLAAADNWLSGADSATDISDATNAITVTINPRITSATYDAATGTLAVTATNLQAKGGATNDIDASKLTFTGEGGSTYTLTDSADVEISSTTAFTVTLSATDKAAINQIINKNGTDSTGTTPYNLAAADDWNTNATGGDTSDTTGNGITAANVAVPAITSTTYDAGTGALVVTGSGFLKLNGTANDIDASKFTFTGEGGDTYALTDSADVDITSGTAFTLTLSSADKAAVNQIINKDGTHSTDGTTYNLAASEDWATGANSAVTVADLTGNGITVANVATPTITSATYSAGTGALVVTGSGFLKSTGAINDIIADKFTLTGEGGATYTLTDTADVEITSGAAFTLMLSATDKIAANLLVNKAGTASADATPYNLAAAEDWIAGADAADTVADLAGNGITATLTNTSSGGGGDSSTPTFTTIDGVITQTTLQSNGTVITTVPPVSNNRQDDPNSLFRDYADVPVNNSGAEAQLTISLPIDAGMHVASRHSLNAQDAINDVIQHIEQAVDSNDQSIEAMIHQAETYLSTLTSDQRMSVHVVTPSITSQQAPNVPVIITGPHAENNDPVMLIIDASNLPPGTAIQLDNVAFAAIIGATRLVGGNGNNVVVGDQQGQFIVLGAGNDTLSGGDGDDTIGSLSGDDQLSGDIGDDRMFGGSGHDSLVGGAGNDQFNGGIGYDDALQDGQLADYQVDAQGGEITLAHADGTVDTFTDVELIRFSSGPSLAVAYSEVEAAAHHLAKTWLNRDLTVAEGDAIENWKGATINDILDVFYNLPETQALDVQNKAPSELLAGMAANPHIVQINANREVAGGDTDDQAYLPLGLALNADGHAGHDVLRMAGGRDDVYLEFVDGRLQLTQLNDGAMLSLTNAEMIAFDSGETVVIAHNETEAILARLVHSFFNRDATREEWQSGRQALDAQVSHDIILHWFQQQADLETVTDTEYVATLYSQTLGRPATSDELSTQLARLGNDAISRDWLAVEIAQSSEAASHLVGSVLQQEGWI